MLLALNEIKERIRATKNESALCPVCNEPVIPKCGTINIHHWSHKPNSNCQYGEGMSEWHMRLQQHALDNGGDIEVIIKDGDNNYHIADILYKNRIIELQHSSISSDDILKRSVFFYNKKYSIDWVLDYRENNFVFISEREIKANGYRKKRFDWFFNSCFGKILFDLDNDVFFYVQSKGSEDWWESNDYGSVKKHLEVYNGFKTNNFLNPSPRIEALLSR